MQGALQGAVGLLMAAGSLVLVSAPVRADVVTRTFAGTVTAVNGTAFGLTTSVGQTVEGSFTYDTGLPPAYDNNGVAGYIQQSPSGMTVVVGGLTLRSEDYNSFQVINDAFGADGVNGFFTPILAGGVPRADGSSMSFNLSDSTQTALSGTALPASLNFAAFGQRTGNIYDGTTGGSVEFQLDAPLPAPLLVKIDVRPGVFPNTVAPSRATVVPVALLTTKPSDNISTFSATAVNVASVRFGAVGAGAAPLSSTRTDVDGDGDTDLLLTFDPRATGIRCGDATAVLTGLTTVKRRILATDNIKTTFCP